MIIDNKLEKILVSVDTPTISNALDVFRGKRIAEGYTKKQFVNFNYNLKPIIGIARTAKIIASKTSDMNDNELNKFRMEYYEYISNKPREQKIKNICVIEDLDYPNLEGSFWGEVNVSIHKGLGLAGTLTNGLLRDLDDIDKDYFILANSIGPSHACVHVVEFGSKVNICGLHVRDGDIIHADKHGAINIPHKSLQILPDAIKYMKRKEYHLINAAKKKDFDIKKLKIAWKKANSEKFKNID